MPCSNGLNVGLKGGCDECATSQGVLNGRCVLCSAGQAQINGTCASIPRSYYKAYSDSSYSRCPDGTTTPDVNSISEEQCTVECPNLVDHRGACVDTCPEGTIQNGKACDACPGGKELVDGSC